MGASSRQWRTVGGIAIEAATCAFADAARLPANFSLQPGVLEQSELRVQDGAQAGLPLIACATMEDCPLPVEVLRDEVGESLAARMCFTTDVDEVRGRWSPVGTLEITRGRALAADPYCLPGEIYRLEFDLSNGRYVAEVFECTEPKIGWDILGLRIRREDLGEPEVSAGKMR